MNETTQLLLFTRSPFESGIKTRLAECCSEADRKGLLHAFVWDTLESLRNSQLTDDHAIRVLTASNWQPDPPSEPSSFPLPSWLGPAALKLQADGNLGERQVAGILTAVQDGFSRIIIVGSDSPTLSPRHLHLAAERLAQAELVVGPADDGGYYLLGLNLRRIQAGEGDPETNLRHLFLHIHWSTDTVCQKLTANAQVLGWQARFLPELYDVDTCRDLQRLAQDLRIAPGTAPQTAAFLENLRGPKKVPTAPRRFNRCH
ncbi:MAG: glycosyltransferase [Blastocatellia bacterium]|nr:glycosyltransferase [Blastocatellia bacterium]